MPQEPEIKVGDVVTVPFRRGQKRTGVGKVLSINGDYCKVYITNNGPKGHYWTGKFSDVRRSYAIPNPQPE